MATTTMDTEQQDKFSKLEAYDLFKSIGSPKYVVAPMVDQSELPFRLLCKRYGAQLTYTPMFHSKIWCQDESYRKTQFSTCELDTPLCVQFCANNPETFVQAGKLLLQMYPEHNKNIATIDLNLGCPQQIAKRGHYGSYLMEEPKLICEMVHAMHTQIDVPISCKIRVFPDVQHTLHYAEQILDAGCQLLTVHGRTREIRKNNLGPADWNQIKAVREMINKRAKPVPLIANGNIAFFEDIQKCMDFTGADGVMSAETILFNPKLFSGKSKLTLEERCDLTLEYLGLLAQYPVPTYMSRAHIFKIMNEVLDGYNMDDARNMIIKSTTVPEFEASIKYARNKLDQIKQGLIQPDLSNQKYKPDENQAAELFAAASGIMFE